MRALARSHGGTWQALQAFLLPLVVALSVSIAVSDAFPLYARMLAGPQTHVCACRLEHGQTDCACPICHPEHAADYALDVESIRGKCGSDSITSGGKLGLAIAPSPVVTVSFGAIASVPALAPPPGPNELFVPPPVPPPRRASV
ncbi:MAG: hypothetical protein ABI551_08770 [Polyangiaceae bacterium]